ncbi:hypothetical protein O181_044131 [Austropuccinia psidii MF-1]|uniref:Uncharacterized protein n=1 Tax=Austropuccinia psidii MF-1 TaxID=1389203 RepID=A0A9Q3HGL4_9BASI|nr:hypothetical protein [Austropuccinia psidii MF-1]
MSSFLWQIGPYWWVMTFGKHHLSLAIYGLRPYPASLAFLANLPPQQPPGQFPCFGPGGPSELPGASGPWSHPFDYEVWGPFRPLRPLQSVGRNPWPLFA